MGGEFNAYGQAPPRGLEPRLSAPEADALSTELRGRALRFYHTGLAHPSQRRIMPLLAVQEPLIRFAKIG